MATSLIDPFKGSFDPTKYSDTYTDRLVEVIRRRQRGEEVHEAPEVEPEDAPDLIEALRASLEAHQGRQRKAPSRRKTTSRRSSDGPRGTSRR